MIHLRDYCKTENKYEILTLRYTNKINSYLKEKLPIIIYNLPVNNINTLFSALTMSSQELKLNIGYYKHINDSCFIYTDADTTLELMIPKEISNFKKMNTINGIVNLNLSNKNYRYILVNIYRNNIVFIPRYWIFRVINSKGVNIVTNKTFFSNLFSVFN